jgi:hypothetical protein
MLSVSVFGQPSRRDAGDALLSIPNPSPSRHHHHRRLLLSFPAVLVPLAAAYDLQASPPQPLASPSVLQAELVIPPCVT